MLREQANECQRKRRLAERDRKCAEKEVEKVARHTAKVAERYERKRKANMSRRKRKANMSEEEKLVLREWANECDRKHKAINCRKKKIWCLGSEQMSMEESVKQIYVGRRKVVEIEDMPLVRFVE